MSDSRFARDVFDINGSVDSDDSDKEHDAK